MYKMCVCVWIENVKLIEKIKLFTNDGDDDQAFWDNYNTITKKKKFLGKLGYLGVCVCRKRISQCHRIELFFSIFLVINFFLLEIDQNWSNNTYI